MCLYSAFVKEVSHQWPGIMAVPPSMPSPIPPPYTFYPNGLGYAPTPAPIDPKLLEEIRDIGKRLDRIDKQLGLKDCKEEESSKRAFEKRLDFALIQQAKDLKKSVECKDNGCESVKGISGVIRSGTVAASIGNAIHGFQAGVAVGDGAAQAAKGIQST